MERIYNDISMRFNPLPLNLIYLENLTTIIKSHITDNIEYSTDKYRKIQTIEKIKSHLYNELRIKIIHQERYSSSYIVFTNDYLLFNLDNENGISELMAKDIKEYLEFELQNFQNGIEPIIMNQKKEQVIIHNINSNNVNSIINSNNEITNINSHNVNSTNDSNNKTNTENKKKSLTTSILEHPIIAGIIVLFISIFMNYLMK